MSKDVMYYKTLSELYYLDGVREVKLTGSLMTVQGCLMEMQMDLFKYRQDHGETDSFKNSIARVEILLKEIDLFSKIQTDNYILRKLIKDQRNEIEGLKSQLFDTVKKTHADT